VVVRVPSFVFEETKSLLSTYLLPVAKKTSRSYGTQPVLFVPSTILTTDFKLCFFLDDGNDAELETAIKNLSFEYPNLYYHARIKIKGVPHHFKAGNLTGGTDFVTKLEGVNVNSLLLWTLI